jgi:hypothetical protein
MTAALVLVTMLTGACSHASARGEEPVIAVPSQTQSTSARRADSEREAVAAYRGMWHAFVDAGKVSDPDAPALRAYATRDALKLIVSALLTNRQRDRVILGQLVIDPKVSAAKPPDSPIEVSIDDCVNDEKWLVHKASGGLVDDEPGGRHHTTAVVVSTGDAWMVSSFELGRSGTC